MRCYPGRMPQVGENFWKLHLVTKKNTLEQQDSARYLFALSSEKADSQSASVVQFSAGTCHLRFISSSVSLQHNATSYQVPPGRAMDQGLSHWVLSSVFKQCWQISMEERQFPLEEAMRPVAEVVFCKIQDLLLCHKVLPKQSS